jgi:FkbM family methyltransferase
MWLMAFTCRVWIKILAALVGVTGEVHAFEPQKYLSGLVHTSVSLSETHWKTVTVHNAAVGEDIGEVELPLFDYHGGVSHLDYHSMTDVAQRTWVDVGFGSGKGLSDASRNQGKTLKVPQVSLDSLNLRCPALIKLDVEGMEEGVLAGAKELLANCRPMPILYVVR